MDKQIYSFSYSSNIYVYLNAERGTECKWSIVQLFCVQYTLCHIGSIMMSWCIITDTNDSFSYRYIVLWITYSEELVARPGHLVRHTNVLLMKIACSGRGSMFESCSNGLAGQAVQFIQQRLSLES